MLEIGQKIKDFVLLDAYGQKHQLSSYKGKKIVIYFYPKDDTPGCTTQACAFRDAYDEFKSRDVVVIGISKDDEKSHQKFIKKYDLPFVLLSDPKAEVATYFDAYGEKKMYGKTYMGIFRKTFVLDESLNLIHIFEAASPSTNAQEIIEILNNLK
ncbi:MAG: thioredoxin-dependent thiol peroxidase [Acholeplasmataceae bacterium]